MSEQNSYRITRKHKVSGWYQGDRRRGETWQDVIQGWLKERDKDLADVSYQLVAETPSEDGKSGSMVVHKKLSSGNVMDYKIKATLIDN